MNKLITTMAVICVLFVVSTEAGADMKPRSIDFDRGLEATRVHLQASCDTLEERKFDPPQLPGTKNAHIQLDCHGFEFEGQERLAEFVFRDGELVLVWILTTAAEEDGLEKKLEASYGPPSYQSKDFTAFTKNRAALRKDVKEVLFYSPSMDQMFQNWFANNVQRDK